MNEVSCKAGVLTEEELTDIARFHEQWISSGFLSSLGVEFLARLYASIAEDPNGILIAAKDAKGKVVGFVSGATSLRSIYQHLIQRHFAFLLLFSLKFIFSPKILRRILENKNYSSQEHTGEKRCSAELLSIVVDERLRGAGIAQGLFEAFKAAFRQKGVDRFKIVVGSQLVPAQKFYTKVGAIKVAEVELHQGELSFVYECSV